MAFVSILKTVIANKEGSAPNSFITFFFCEVNKENGEIVFVNAGHNPPLVLGKKGMELLKAEIRTMKNLLKRGLSNW